MRHLPNVFLFLCAVRNPIIGKNVRKDNFCVSEESDSRKELTVAILA